MTRLFIGYVLLSAGEAPIKGGFISRFKSYSDMLNYARYADDSDLLHKIEIVTQHGHDIIKFIAILKERCNHSIESASKCVFLPKTKCLCLLSFMCSFTLLWLSR